MNDVDYINLSTNDTTKNVTASQTISRANIFYNTSKNYIATYFKYYVDLEKESNKETIQQLPTLHYHRYLDTFLEDHVIYNLNMKSNYLHRTIGTTAIQTDLSIPITVRTSLFDEYLNISYQTQLYTQYTNFQNDTSNPKFKEYDNGYYARNYNQLNASTQLTKAYDNYIHTIGFSTSYIRSGFDKRSGFYEDCKDDDTCDTTFYNISDIQEAVTLNFSQYIFEKSGKQLLYHRLSEIIADPGNENTIGELESELDMYVTDNLKYYNNLLYNFTYDKISKQLNKITYTNYGFNLSLSHFYKKDFKNNTKTSYITSSFKYRYNSHYSYTASYDYDIEYKIKKRAEIGFLYQKRCWDFGLRYTENNRPILTNNNASSIYDRYLYFTVVLKPLMKPTASDFFGLRLPKVLNGS
jgi:LPS-assembly protein